MQPLFLEKGCNGLIEKLSDHSLTNTVDVWDKSLEALQFVFCYTFCVSSLDFYYHKASNYHRTNFR